MTTLERSPYLDGLVLNLVRTVFLAVLDRHACALATKTFIANYSDARTITEETILYNEIIVIKIKNSSQKFLKSMSVIDLRDLSNLNVTEFLDEIVCLVQKEMGMMKMPCEWNVIYNVLYTILALMERNTNTPFVEMVLKDVEQKQEYKDAAESMEKFMKKVEEELEKENERERERELQKEMRKQKEKITAAKGLHFLVTWYTNFVYSYLWNIFQIYM